MQDSGMQYRFAPALGKMSSADVDSDLPARSGFYEYFDRWYAYINGGEEPPFSARNNLQVMAMITAAIESIEGGKPCGIAEDKRFAAAFR